MSNIFKILQSLLNSSMFCGTNKAVYSVGPNNLSELLMQFDQPAHQKSTKQLADEIYYTEKFKKLELDFLKSAPDTKFTGSWKTENSDGTMDIDFVPCVIRPEVFFCCYGKN